MKFSTLYNHTVSILTDFNQYFKSKHFVENNIFNTVNLLCDLSDKESRCHLTSKTERCLQHSIPNSVNQRLENFTEVLITHKNSHHRNINMKDVPY